MFGTANIASYHRSSLRFSVLALTKHLLCNNVDGKFSDKMREHNGNEVKVIKISNLEVTK